MKSLFGNMQAKKIYIRKTAADDYVLQKKMYVDGVQVYSAGNKVTYYVDTDSVYTEEVEYEKSCLSPKTFMPAKSGWTFVGWRGNKTATSSVYSSLVMGDEPITLYAVFKQEITVTYYNNTSTKATTSGTQYYNNGNIANPSFTLTQAAKSGWTARGWSADTAGNAGVTYKNATAFTRDSNITLYGLYQAEVSGTFYSGSAKAAATSVTGTKYYNSSGNLVGASITAPSSATAISGWTWRNGWSGNGATAGNAAVTYAKGAAITGLTSNIACYALYSKACTLTCISNGTQMVTGTAYYNSAGNTVNAFVEAPTGAAISGWTWRGWSSGGVTTANAAVSFANGATVNLGTTSHTIYGLYQRTLTATFNGNGAASGSMGTLSGINYYNSAGNHTYPTITLPSNGFAKSGYAFVKWAAGSAGGTQYAAGAGYQLTGNVVFYAVWKLVYLSFSGNYKQSDGTMAAATKVAEGLYFYGTVYSEWHNNTGNAVSVTVVVQNKCGSYDTSSGVYLYLNTVGKGSMEDPDIVLSFAYEDIINYGSTSKTITVPAGYYLVWFNQHDAHTIITAKVN